MQIKFNEPLVEGLIKSRPNRFIMFVDIDGVEHRCHCPSTGRIGNIVFEDVPCLMTPAQTKGRTTDFTVEAISVDPPERKNKSWIGINQNRINKYVEHFIREGAFDEMLPEGGEIKHEVALGDSRLDLKVGNAYIEVKMPLIDLPVGTRTKTKTRPPSRFDQFDRLIKHFGELADQKGEGSRAILLLAFMYDAPPFVPPPRAKDNERIFAAAEDAQARGVENWQVNLGIDGNAVMVLDNFKLSLFP